MLKRFILKPMATAAAEIMSGVARLSMPCKTFVSPAAPKSVEYAFTGSLPVMSRMTAQMTRATMIARTELADVTSTRCNF
jgi:hypothetical protein